VVLGTEFDSDGDWFAFTGELGSLWDTTGDNADGPGGKDRIYAHFPHVGDVDRDWREELAGSWLIDDDGTRGYRQRARRLPRRLPDRPGRDRRVDELLVHGAAGRPPERHPSPWRDPGYARAVAETQDDTHPERRRFDWRAVGCPASGCR
jgi:hypothetical protein